MAGSRLKKADLVAWFLAIGVITCQTYPLITGQELAGWDTEGHYYLFQKLLGYLSQGRLSGYDPNWFAGYPAFTLYPPLVYLLMAVPHLVSLDWITPLLSFNLFFFLLPFFLLLSAWWTARVYAGDKAGVPALLFTLLYLLLDWSFQHLGLGLGGLLEVGFPANYFALSLLVLLLGLLELQRRNVTRRVLILIVFVLAGLFLSHSLTTLFSMWLLVLFLLFVRPARLTRLCLAVAGAAAVSSFWLVPFVSNIGLSSGKAIGWRGEIWADPLLALYPRLQLPYLKSLLYELPAVVFIPLRAGKWLQIEAPALLVGFPFLAVMLLVCGIIGIVRLLRTGRPFLPMAFLVSALFLPQDYFPSVLNLPVHYYRFVQPIFIINVLVSACGACFLIEAASSLSHPALARAAKLSLSAFAVVALVGTTMNGSAWRGSDKVQRLASGASPYLFHPQNYSGYKAAQRMIDLIGRCDAEGRVAVEAARSDAALLASPHFFTARLPLQAGVSVLPGLLAESALSTGFLMPVLGSLGTDFSWGRQHLLGDPTFNRQPIESMIIRLGLFNVQFLLSTSAELAAPLAALAPKYLLPEETFGSFSLFRLVDYRPFLEETSYRPFLFVDRGGIDFRVFAEQWFKYPQLFERPVIYTPRRYEELPKEEQDRIGGFIVSYPNNEVLSMTEYASWQQLGKPVLFLDAKPPLPSAEMKKVFFPLFYEEGPQRHFAATLAGQASQKIVRREVRASLREAEQLRFSSSQGVLVNYNYSPYWRDTSGRTVYWATPSLMFVFGHGDNELRYR